MQRREFITLVGSAAASWSLAARAQQQTGKAPKVGLVYPGPEAAAPPRVEALLNGLRAAGYLAPAQVDLALRVADGDPSRIMPLVKEVVDSNVDIFFATGLAVLRAIQSVSPTIPIVMLDLESDPVDIGLVASLAHPGGNVTGVFLAFPDFATKWLGLLKETIPQLSRLAVLWDPSTGTMQKKSVEGAAEAFKVTLQILEVPRPFDLDEAFVSASREGAGAVLMLSSPVIGGNVKKTAELAILHHLPTITLFPDFGRAGGLMAYGPNLLGTWRQAGVMIGKVLQGTQPADLPIERPTEFELVINMKTAKALGLKVPLSLQASADEVID
jgi:putative ABC transport system substrate-binding protein